MDLDRLREKNPEAECPTLRTFLREDYQGQPGRIRRALAEELGRQVRRLHDDGRVAALWWADWNLSSCRSLPEFATSREIGGGRSPGSRIREKNLLRAYREVGEEFSRAEVLRFLRGYLGGLKDTLAREFVGRIFRRSRYALRRRLCSGRFLAESDLVSVEKKGSFRTFREQSKESAFLAARISSDTESLLADGELLPGRGSKSRAVRIEVAGNLYFLKCFQGGRTYWRSRARSVWLLSWWLRLNDIPVPRPLLLQEGPVGQAWLLTEFADGYRRLADLWPQAGTLERKTLVIRVAILLGRVHRLGWIHGDFNWNNILVGRAGDLLLVDLDCAKPLGYSAGHRLFRDVQHFLRDLLRPANQGEAWTGLFLCTWRRWSGVDALPPSLSVNTDA